MSLFLCLTGKEYDIKIWISESKTMAFHGKYPISTKILVQCNIF